MGVKVVKSDGDEIVIPSTAVKKNKACTRAGTYWMADSENTRHQHRMSGVTMPSVMM